MESVRQAAESVRQFMRPERSAIKSLDGQDVRMQSVEQFEVIEPEEATRAYGKLCPECRLHHRGDCY